jgi:hypothetical protein
MHVAHSLEGDKTGDESATVAVEPRVSLPAQREVGAGEARHRDAALPDGDIRQRMLLARTQCEV